MKMGFIKAHFELCFLVVERSLSSRHTIASVDGSTLFKTFLSHPNFSTDRHHTWRNKHTCRILHIKTSSAHFSSSSSSSPSPPPPPPLLLTPPRPLHILTGHLHPNFGKTEARDGVRRVVTIRGRKVKLSHLA